MSITIKMMEITVKNLFITGEAPEFSVYVVVFKQTIILVRTILAIMPEKNMVVMTILVPEMQIQIC